MTAPVVTAAAPHACKALGVAPRWQEIIARAVSEGAPGEDSPLVAIMDFDQLTATVGDLRAAFQEPWRHRFAVKANPLRAVLAHLASLGLDMEAASAGEIAACLGAGIASARISFNSPVKTLPELRKALAARQPLSIDNFQELERVAGLMDTLSPGEAPPVGIRVNPQLGEGAIGLTSTGGKQSRFGIAIGETEQRGRLLEAFRTWPWLTFLHVHGGSQGVAPERLAAGIGAVADLAAEIDRACGRPAVTMINIGGGLSVAADPTADNPSFASYAGLLRETAPVLFSGEIAVETEFGRSITARSGILLARVEYTKVAGGRLIAATHAGSPVAVRTALAPDDWPLAVTLLGPDGSPKEETLVETDLAGPCCYGGDLLCRGRLLPRAEPGDFVLIHTAGAYGFSAHYDFNLIARPGVLAATGTGDSLRLTPIRSPQDPAAPATLLG